MNAFKLRLHFDKNSQLPKLEKHLMSRKELLRLPWVLMENTILFLISHQLLWNLSLINAEFQKITSLVTVLQVLVNLALNTARQINKNTSGPFISKI